MNVGIKIGDTFLDLGDANFEYNIFNSATHEGSIVNDYAQRFKIPGGKTNKKVFEFAEYLQVRNRARVYAGELYAEGVLKNVGSVILHQADHKADGDQYHISFSSNGFVVSVLGKSLKTDVEYPSDVSLGATTSAVVTHCNGIVVQNYPDVNYNFPEHKNESFYGSSNDEFDSVINRWDQANQTFLENENVDGSGAVNKYSLVAWLYVKFVLLQIADTFGFSIVGDFMDHDELDDLILYDNYSLDAKDHQSEYARAGRLSEYSTGTSNEQIVIDDDSTSPFEDTQGNFDTGIYQYSIPTYGQYEIKFSLDVYADSSSYTYYRVVVNSFEGGNFIEGTEYNFDSGEAWEEMEGTHTFTATSSEIASTFSLFIYFEGSNDEVSWTGINGKYNNVDVAFTNLSLADLNTYAKSLHYANHVPDILVSKFLNGLRDFFNLQFDFDPLRNEVRIDFAQDSLGRTAKDVSNDVVKGHELFLNENIGKLFRFSFSGDDLADDNFPDLSDRNILGEYTSISDIPSTAVIGDVAVISKDNGLYSYNLTDSGLEWQRIGDNFYPYPIGDETKEHEPEFAPMMMRIIDGISSNDQSLVPVIEESGSSPAFDLGLNEPSLRFCFYRGMQDGEDDEYPFASSYNFTYDGSQVGDISLRWDDDTYGLYVTFWEAWMNFWLNKVPVEVFMDLTEAKLRELGSRHPISFAYSKFVIDEIVAAYNMKGLGQVKAKLYKIEAP